MNWNDGCASEYNLYVINTNHKHRCIQALLYALKLLPSAFSCVISLQIPLFKPIYVWDHSRGQRSFKISRVTDRHGFNQQNPTQPNTTHKVCWLLCTQQPTFVQLVVVYPTTNIHNFISWCCVPNTSNCWVVLCTQLFSKKIQHEKRIISTSRVFLLFKKQACYGHF